MSYYRTCPRCGANLDPGERCDCDIEKAASDAANIEGGKAEKNQSISASIVPDSERGCQSRKLP